MYIANQQGAAGYYAFHLNALYDLCNRIYVDALIQPESRMYEQRAMSDMTDRSDIDGKVIVIADRNYESYNVFAHAERKGWNYLIRVKDLAHCLPLNPFSATPRLEWGVEAMHWLLDVHFNEDKTRVWDMNVQKTLNLTRKIALNLATIFKNSSSSKIPISGILKRNLFDVRNLAAFLAFFSN